MAGPMSPYLALAAALTLGLILGASIHALWQARPRVQPMRPLPEVGWSPTFGPESHIAATLQRQVDEEIWSGRRPDDSVALDDESMALWEAADLGPFDDADDDPFWGEYPPPPYPHPSESTTLTRHAVADMLRHRESTGGP